MPESAGGREDGFAGPTAIEASVTELTVKFVEPATPACEAWIEAVPVVRAVARPAGLTATMAGALELHDTLCVKSWVDPPE